MTQSTILAAGNTSATSTDVVVAAGAHVHIGIFGVAGTYLPAGFDMAVMMDTPNGDLVYNRLDDGRQQIHVIGPGTWRVVRAAYTGSAFGVFLEA
jgi:hypothetical protein